MAPESVHDDNETRVHVRKNIARIRCEKSHRWQTFLTSNSGDRFSKSSGTQTQDMEAVILSREMAKLALQWHHIRLKYTLFQATAHVELKNSFLFDRDERGGYSLITNDGMMIKSV